MRRSWNYVVIEVPGECGPTVPTKTEEEQLAVVKSLPVVATIAALEEGRSPTPALTVAQVQRKLTELFGDKVTHVHNGTIRSREEDR